MIDWVTEEFVCLPSVAREELEEHGELVMSVLWARNYARAKAAYEGKANLDMAAQAALMSDPMVRVVQEVEGQLMQEAYDAKMRTSSG